jgi:FkbM family methyltransferase
MFEPNPGEHPHLQQLVRRYPDLHLHRVGLSSVTTTGELKVPIIAGTIESALATLRPEGVPQASAHVTVSVALQCLDEIASHLPRPFDLIKCDVEGHELEVLRGAISTLEEHRPVLLIEIERRHCGQDLETSLELLEQLEYDGFFYLSGRQHPIREFEAREHQDVFSPETYPGRLPTAYVHDFLFVPRESGSRKA